MEPVQSRNAGHLVTAMSKLHAKFRMLGINVMWLHTDREKSFHHAKVQKWCDQRQLVQTMTSGDDPAANGRCEVELSQMKQRLTLLLHESGVDMGLWPCAARHAAQERFRLQVDRLGLSMGSSGSEGQTLAQGWSTSFKSLQVNAVAWPLSVHFDRVDYQG